MFDHHVAVFVFLDKNLVLGIAERSSFTIGFDLDLLGFGDGVTESRSRCTNDPQIASIREIVRCAEPRLVVVVVWLGEDPNKIVLVLNEMRLVDFTPRSFNHRTTVSDIGDTRGCTHGVINLIDCNHWR